VPSDSSRSFLFFFPQVAQVISKIALFQLSSQFNHAPIFKYHMEDTLLSKFSSLLTGKPLFVPAFFPPPLAVDDDLFSNCHSVDLSVPYPLSFPLSFLLGICPVASSTIFSTQSLVLSSYSVFKAQCVPFFLLSRVLVLFFNFHFDQLGKLFE